MNCFTVVKNLGFEMIVCVGDSSDDQYNSHSEIHQVMFCSEILFISKRRKARHYQLQKFENDEVCTLESSPPLLGLLYTPCFFICFYHSLRRYIIIFND